METNNTEILKLLQQSGNYGLDPVGPLMGLLQNMTYLSGAKLAETNKELPNVDPFAVPTYDNPTIMEQVKNKLFAFGGTVGKNIPINIEGNEVIETPDGAVSKIKGKSHSQGGENIDLPEGTKVYSNKIEVGNKTLAQRKQYRETLLDRLMTKSKNDVSDVIIRNTYSRTKTVFDIMDYYDSRLGDIVNTIIPSVGPGDPPTKTKNDKNNKNNNTNTKQKQNNKKTTKSNKNTKNQNISQELEPVGATPELKKYGGTVIGPDDPPDDIYKRSNKFIKVGEDTSGNRWTFGTEYSGKYFYNNDNYLLDDATKWQQGIYNRLSSWDKNSPLVIGTKTFKNEQEFVDYMNQNTEYFDKNFEDYLNLINDYNWDAAHSALYDLTNPNGNADEQSSNLKPSSNIGTGFTSVANNNSSNTTIKEITESDEPIDTASDTGNDNFGNKGLNMTIGDMFGFAGNVLGGLGPMSLTIANRTGDTKNISFFKQYGERGNKTVDDSIKVAKQIADEALKSIDFMSNNQYNRNRMSARTINVQRALDTTTHLQSLKAREKLASDLMQVTQQALSNKAQLQNQQDQVRMGAEYQADLANRQDRDVFYTNLNQDLNNTATIMQKTGSDINQLIRNKMFVDMLPELTANGIGLQYDAYGNVIMTDPNGNVRVLGNNNG